MGRLEIRVCAARNVANLQKVGKPDPYVKVKMGDKKKTQIKYKTRVIENNLNPIWNELFKFQVADYDSTQVLFELWNDNVLVDDLLGSYNLSINGLVRGVVVDTWAILTGTKGSSSELHLRILAVDFGRDPAPTDRVITSLEQDNLAPPTNQTYRPPKNYTPVVQSSYPAAPQGLPQPVVYGQQNYGAAMPAYAPQPPPMQQQPMYGGAPPPQQQQQGYGYGAPPPPPQQQQPYGYGAPPPPPQQGYGYGAPPPPQPMFGAPPPPQRPPYMGGGPPPPQMYGPPPPQQSNMQMAYGVPPDM